MVKIIEKYPFEAEKRGFNITYFTYPFYVYTQLVLLIHTCTKSPNLRMTF